MFGRGLFYTSRDSLCLGGKHELILKDDEKCSTINITEESYRECEENFNKLDADEVGIITYNLRSINIDDLAIRGKEKELYDFLNTLDYEVVKALLVIMYIGRDSFCKEDGTKTIGWY